MIRNHCSFEVIYLRKEFIDPHHPGYARRGAHKQSAPVRRGKCPLDLFLTLLTSRRERVLRFPATMALPL
jgi:hypothetical protein